MSPFTIDGSKDEEEEILDEQLLTKQNSNQAGGSHAKAKAMQQLAISEDSPFNLTCSRGPNNSSKTELQLLNDLKEEKACLLRNETEEIKKQLELVKSRLNELNVDSKIAQIDASSVQKLDQTLVSDNGRLSIGLAKGKRHKIAEMPTPAPINICNRKHEIANNQQTTSSDSQFHRNANEKFGFNKITNCRNNVMSNSISDPKFRPLTGKTDCPNCNCDRRRSVCDKCIKLQQRVIHNSADQRRAKSENVKRSLDFTTKKPESFLDANQEECGKQQQMNESNFNKHRDYDEKPIRPAKQRLEDIPKEVNGPTPKAKIVDDVIVPNKLYAIGRSLNEKRSKLAEAIQDLQSMTERVKKRGDRLEQERKLAQMYKDQWKFGPIVGSGCRVNSRESLKGSGQYLSRFDPNLARDSKSMMGFQHVEPVMRAQQQDSKMTSTHKSTFWPLPPQPAPRLSKMNSVKSRNQSSNNYLRSTRASTLHSRSKSLEIIPKIAQKSPVNRQTNVSKKSTSSQNGDENFQNGRSSSVSNLGSSGSVNSIPDQSVEEDIEEEIQEETKQKAIFNDDSSEVINSNREEHRLENEKQNNIEDPVTDVQESAYTDNIETGHLDNVTSNERVKRTWVPVFGETEIKTITRRAPERKVLVLNGSRSVGNSLSSRGSVMQLPNNRKSILRTENKYNRTKPSLIDSNNRKMSTGRYGDRVLNEATKKLQFANNLLEREYSDSQKKNQLIINKMDQNKTRSAPLAQMLTVPNRISSPVSNGSDSNQEQCYRTNRSKKENHDTQASEIKNLIFGANEEISRLEKMISEQQKLLLKLSTSNQPPTLTSCCCNKTHSPCGQIVSSTSQSGRQRHTNCQPSRLFINHLKERLNKTRTRLARTLEEERAKHQRLEQKFDSSLRKQSDLEKENDLLKQSLSRCIDTCLKDISNTFESLSASLSESVDRIDYEAVNESEARALNSVPGETAGTQPTNIIPDPLLTNAAQLIEDNRHLRRMKTHIDSIEQQRRGIFEELNHEKHKSEQLELELKQSKLELEQLIKAKRRLEAQLAASRSAIGEEEANKEDEGDEELKQHPDDHISPKNLSSHATVNSSSTTKQVNFTTADADAPTASDSFVSNFDPQATIFDSSITLDDGTSMTFSSIDMYKQYIQSMTPDLDAIRRERRMILNEFDNIKRMLSDMDS